MNDSKTSNDSGKSKHKKKVSFSFFEISTFDELAKLRKLREEEFEDFVSNKKKTNQYISNLNQRNKILSMSNNELISFDNNDKSNNYNNISKNHIMKNTYNNIVGIPRPVKKEESSANDSYFNNQEYPNDAFKNKMSLNKKSKKVMFSDDEEDMKSNEIFSSPQQINSDDKNEIINDISNIKSPINTKYNNIIIPENNLSSNNNINSNEINENNIITTEINENQDDNNNKDNNYEQNNIIKDSKNIDDNNNIQEIINKSNINENEIRNENNNKLDDINDNKNKEEIIDEKNNLDNINENEDNIENNLNNNIEATEENNKKKFESNVTNLYNILEKVFQISPTYKISLIQEFFTNLLNYIDYQFDKYLDYESNDSKFLQEIENKSRLIHLNIYYNLFVNNIKERIEKKKLYNEHKLKAKKYAQYMNYKYKVYAFNNLLTFGIKQKEWIKTIHAGFMRKLIWECFENLKIYTNYRKAKGYLILRKKKIIFDTLKNNKQLSIQLLKNGKKLSLIFEYRHFFNNCRKKILGQKGKEINDKLVNEFRNQYLLRGIFNIIKKNRDIRKEKENAYNNMIMNKYQRGKEFINIKVTTKETVRYQNGNTFMRIQSKINA